MGRRMGIRCDACGVTSELEVGYQKLRRSFRRSRRVECPSCFAGRGRRDLRRSLWVFLLAGAAGLWLVSLDSSVDAGWLLVNVFLLALFTAPVVLLHEAGHAFAGRALGLRIFRVILGYGQPLWRGRCFGLDVELRALQLGGMTVLTPASLSGVVWRMALAILAGPLTNGALAGLAYWLSQAGSLQPLASRFAPAEVWILLNVLHLIGNLLPYRVRTELGVQESDGLLLLQLLFAPGERLEQWLAARFALEVVIAREESEFQRAREWAERGLAAHPKHELLEDLVGIVLMDSGDHDRARAHFQRGLAEPDLVPERAAFLKNNLAYAAFLSERDDLLEEADALSAEALRAIGWHPALRGTRGAVLVALGEAERALPLLDAASRDVEDPASQASLAAAQSLAHAQLGDPERAKKALERARKLDPRCPLLARCSRVH